MILSIRPGKYIEYDFPLHEVNRLAVKEANAKKPIYTMHKWWARRLSCVFRTILLASAIDWEDWDRLEPWRRDDDGDFVDAGGNKLTDEREYHRRQRRAGLNSAWERLYYRLDETANAAIRWAFTKPVDGSSVRLTEHLASLGLGEGEWGPDATWWQELDWSGREPITVLDPFMGGGTTIVEALRLGANVVGVDLNPVAWFVVKKETDGCDLEQLEQAFRQVEAAVAEEIKQYYRTTCPCCGKAADVMYTFWVKLAPCFEQTCRRCQANDPVPLYNSFVIAKKSGGKKKAADVPRNRQGVAGMKLVEGPEWGIQFIKCPNPDCGEVYASKEKVAAGQSTCLTCATTFNPAEGWARDGKYTCPDPDCGVTQEILAAAKANRPPGMDRNVPLPHRMYALEVYCPHCEFKGYRNASAEDLALFERAKAEFEANRETLNYPTQEIPKEALATGVEHNLAAHGYHYWYEMFNERQLLCLCRLRDAIMAVDDQNVREYLLLAWSAAMETNNLFCLYNVPLQKLENMFFNHAYVPRVTLPENNVWGTDFGRGTFIRMFGQVQKGAISGYDWRDNFFRSDDEYGQVAVPDGPWGRGRASLFSQSSEDLSMLGTLRVPAVVTDPPYYGNVMYAELADFFHVWLRTAISDQYPEEFSRPLTPKDEEVVEDVTRGHGAPFLYKNHAFFTNGLTRIFSETAALLEQDGMLVFTFHHQANEAWASVLQTALDAGYYMTAVVPVHAEAYTGAHIANKANISYDAVIICRRQEAEPRRVDWQDVEDRVFVRAEQLVRELEQRTNGNRLAPEDIYVIAIGKCMEEYSKHYFRGQPYVFKGGQPVGIEEALNGDEGRGIRGIGEIVDQLVEEAEGRMWPAGLDPVSRFYVVNFLGQTEVPYDRLHRRLRHNVHITLEDLEKRQLIKQARGKVKVLAEKEREEYLLAIYSAEEPAQPTFDLGLPEVTDLTYIDKVHLLTVLDQQGVMTGGLREEYSQDATFRELVTRIAQYLDPSARGYKSYQDLAGQVTGQVKMEL
jgi:putative DNA methylase